MYNPKLSKIYKEMYAKDCATAMLNSNSTERCEEIKCKAKRVIESNINKAISPSNKKIL